MNIQIFEVSQTFALMFEKTITDDMDVSGYSDGIQYIIWKSDCLKTLFYCRFDSMHTFMIWFQMVEEKLTGLPWLKNRELVEELPPVSDKRKFSFRCIWNYGYTVCCAVEFCDHRHL